MKTPLVVFVDDSKPVLKTIEILLKNRVQNKEIELRTFSKPADFMDLIDSHQLEPDICFFDINMPFLSGYDLLQKFREHQRFHKIPVIALTTENTKEAIEHGREVGFNEWIVKISAPATLQQSINAMIDKYMPQITESDNKSEESFDKDEALHQIKEMFATIEDLNKRLLIAEENKSRFLSLMYNEFNNPLMSITLLMRDILKDENKTREEIVEEISLVFIDILTLNSQLTNILAAAEIECSTGIVRNLSNFSLQDLISDIIENKQFINRDKNLKLELSLSFPDIIYHDRDKLFLIIKNLVENAFEFSPDGGSVIIKGYIENNQLIFYICNIGSPVQDQSKIYDAFYQERSDFSRIHHGLGLGLAIVKFYADFLGGSIVYCPDDDLNIFKLTIPIDTNAKSRDIQDISSFVFEDDDRGSKF